MACKKVKSGKRKGKCKLKKPHKKKGCGKKKCRVFRKKGCKCKKPK